MISIYAPRCGLRDSQKNDFNVSLMKESMKKIWFRKLKENEILAIVGNFHGHVASNPEDFEGQHDSYGYGRV